MVDRRVIACLMYGQINVRDLSTPAGHAVRMPDTLTGGLFDYSAFGRGGSPPDLSHIRGFWVDFYNNDSGGGRPAPALHPNYLANIGG